MEIEKLLAEEALRDSEQRYRELYVSARRQAQEMALLDRVRTAVAGELDLKGVIRTVVEGIAETFGYPLVSLYMRQGDRMLPRTPGRICRGDPRDPRYRRCPRENGAHRPGDPSG